MRYDNRNNRNNRKNVWERDKAFRKNIQPIKNYRLISRYIIL